MKEEVQKAVNNVDSLYKRWQDLVDNPSTIGHEEHTWTTSEVKNNIRSIEWDVEDLQETITIVETNPAKFNLTATDIQSRREFIRQIKDKVRKIKDHITSSEVERKTNSANRNSLLSRSKTTHNGGKYYRLENEFEASNERFINDQQQQQQVLIEQQDNHLEHVAGSVGVLKSMSTQIGTELDDQTVILDNIGSELETTESKLNNVLLRVEKVLRLADDKRQTYVLIALIVTMVIVVILFVAL